MFMLRIIQCLSILMNIFGPIVLKVFLPHMTGKQKSGMATVMLGCEKELAQTDERDVLVNKIFNASPDCSTEFSELIF